MNTAHNTMQYLRAQCARYPLLEIPDLLKALYQSVYGCGHLVTNPAAALLDEELAALPPDAPADIEPLDGDFCRVHLGYVTQRGLAAGTLLRLFAWSADPPVGSEAALEEKLAVLTAPEAALPFSPQALHAAANHWKEAGFPVCRHSPAFRAAYHPAYRVIRKSFAPLLPLLAAIDQAQAAHGRILVAIEGGSASGKTTLSALLGRIYSCPVFHADDFFLRPEQRTSARLAEPGGNLDRERLLEEVLIPLAEGRPAVFHRYDCHTGTLSEPVTVSPGSVNIIEGAYSMHPQLAAYYHLSVFMQISPELQRTRILQRNGPEMGKRFFSLWIPLEQAYFEALSPERRCDLVLDAQAWTPFPQPAP